MIFVLLICALSLNQCSASQTLITNAKPAFALSGTRTLYEENWKWPWLSAFVSRQGKQYFCAGSLISKNHILSAAHCFHPKRSNKINPSDILVFLGKPDFNVRLDYEIESCITDIIIHPGWKPNAKSFDADIAIAVLAKEIPISESVYPIWVATPYNSIYSIGHLVGWGRSEDSDPNNPRDHEKVAKELPLKAVTNEVCFLDFPNLVDISSRRTFCAGWRGFEANACHGDSGSGYFVKNQNHQNWEIQGIVSSSPVDSSGKCIVNQYAIFTKVGNYHNWIQAIIHATEITPTQTVTVHCEFLSSNVACILKHIEINNKFAKIRPKLLPIQSTRQLSIVDSSVLAVPLGLREVFPELQVLNITKSYLSFVTRQSVSKLSKINLSLNQISNLNIDTFWDSPGLKVLNLDFNKLFNLDEDLFIYSPELEEFSANSNQIRTLHRDLFNDCHNLKRVLLAGNSLQQIEVDFFNFVNIVDIDLRKNGCINAGIRLENEKPPAKLKFQQEIAINCTGSPYVEQ